MPRRRRGRRSRDEDARCGDALLVGYYGVFQAGHVVFNVVYLSGLRPIPEFPWPPAEGWHPQATAFWTATGLIDTAIALLALYFVAAFFGGRRRALWAGLVSLATYMCTIFVFNYTVVATGAWAQHPVEYVVLNAATIPLGPPVRGGHSQRAGGGRRRGARRDIMAMSMPRRPPTDELEDPERCIDQVERERAVA